jgi:hypothetical protein
MRKILDFIKLWWGKLFGLTARKNFIYIFPLASFLLLAVIPSKIIAFILLGVWVITIVSNTSKNEEKSV